MLSLLSRLLDAAAHNSAHGRPDVTLFESAHVYLPRAGTAASANGSRLGR